MAASIRGSFALCKCTTPAWMTGLPVALSGFPWLVGHLFRPLCLRAAVSLPPEGLVSLTTLSIAAETLSCRRFDFRSLAADTALTFGTSLWPLPSLRVTPTFRVSHRHTVDRMIRTIATSSSQGQSTSNAGFTSSPLHTTPCIEVNRPAKQILKTFPALCTLCTLGDSWCSPGSKPKRSQRYLSRADGSGFVRMSAFWYKPWQWFRSHPYCSSWFNFAPLTFRCRVR